MLAGAGGIMCSLSERKNPNLIENLLQLGQIGGA